MNDDMRLERQLKAVLGDPPSGRAPDGLRVNVLSTSSQIRQRPGWLVLVKERPMRYRSTIAVGSPTIRLAATLAITFALLVAVAAGVVAGASLLPSPQMGLVLILPTSAPSPATLSSASPKPLSLQALQATWASVGTRDDPIGNHGNPP